MDEIIPVDALKDHIEKLDGTLYRVLTLADWTKAIVDEGLNVLVYAYLAAIDDKKLNVVFRKLVKLTM